MKLVIGNRNYSSWSLRAWLYLTESELSFEEIYVPLDTPQWAEDIHKYSPAHRVPILIDGDTTVWDTAAIFEYLLEQHPQSVGWPAQRTARAHARSVSAEMHSGFIALRDELPQNLRQRSPLQIETLSATCQAQVQRVQSIWHDCYQRYGGPWLFGEFSIADVMYAPVALRFLSYSIPLNNDAAAFQNAVQQLPSVQRFVAAAEIEKESLPFVDELIGEANNPLTLG
jgi:glutathione S-transferase